MVLGPGTSAIGERALDLGSRGFAARTVGLAARTMGLREDAHISKHTVIVAVDDSAL